MEPLAEEMEAEAEAVTALVMLKHGSHTSVDVINSASPHGSPASPYARADQAHKVEEEEEINMEDAEEPQKKEKEERKGVSRHKNTKRYEAYLSSSTLKKFGRDLIKNYLIITQKQKVRIGEHSCGQAAARTLDKARLALLAEPAATRELEYSAQDYLPDYIEELKRLEVPALLQKLRQEARGDSADCVTGLNNAAANKLRQAIFEAAQAQPKQAKKAGRRR